MGVLEVPLGIAGSPEEEPAIVSAMVDTGSIHTIIPESLLERLEIQPVDRFRYGLADGSEVEYDYGMACLKLQDQPMYFCPVIFGPDDQYLVGATTLEIFNLMVDPVDGVLVRRVPRARPL